MSLNVGLKALDKRNVFCSCRESKQKAPVVPAGSPAITSTRPQVEESGSQMQQPVASNFGKVQGRIYKHV